MVCWVELMAGGWDWGRSFGRWVGLRGLGQADLQVTVACGSLTQASHHSWTGTQLCCMAKTPRPTHPWPAPTVAAPP